MNTVNVRAYCIRPILAAGFALALAFTFNACGNDLPEDSFDPSNDINVGSGNFGYCDYGPITQWGGGCFEMELADDCNLEWGHIVDVCPSENTTPSSSSNVNNPPPSSSSNVVCTINILGNYLGMGYDVIKSSYINNSDVKKANPILDQNKMCQDAIIVTEIASDQAYEYFTGSSIKEFYQQRNTNIGFGYSTGIGVLFSGKFSAEFSNSTNQSGAERIFYSRAVSHRYTQDDYIKNATASNLSNYLTPSFIDDLKNRDTSYILNQYGTHVFVRYYKGGSLEANYTYTGTVLSSNTTVDAAVRASFAGISGNTGTSSQVTEIESTTNTSFNYYTHGGSAIGATSVTQLKNQYSSWVNSIASNADICGIPNFDQSFIAIWELARAAGETQKAAQLETAFKNRVATQGIALEAATKILKTVQKDYTTSGTQDISSLIPAADRAKATIAEIEIYALGAGGGGQGGNKNVGMVFTETGTGGSGGGGSAAYLKLGNNLGLSVGASVSLSITVGTGGAGGSTSTTSATNAGCGGGNGGVSGVVWSAKGITLSAPGGSGGGSGSTSSCGGTGVNAVKEGAGGIIGSVNPANSDLYMGTPFFRVGNPGKAGNIDHSTSMSTNGGNAATIISSGTLPSFGGGLGATYTAGSSTYNPARAGGGGIGLWQQNGVKGGDGLVTIVVKYIM